MNRLYLCCDHTVPEVGQYDLDEAAEILPDRFAIMDMDEDGTPLGDWQACVRRKKEIKRVLSALPIGHSTTYVPGLRIWAVYDDQDEGDEEPLGNTATAQVQQVQRIVTNLPEKDREQVLNYAKFLATQKTFRKDTP